MSNLFWNAPSASSEGLGASLGVQSSASSSQSAGQAPEGFADLLSAALDQVESTDTAETALPQPNYRMNSATMRSDTSSSLPLQLNLDFQPDANQLSVMLESPALAMVPEQMYQQIHPLGAFGQWQLEQPLVSGLPISEQVSALASWVENFAVANGNNEGLFAEGVVEQVLPSIINAIQANQTDTRASLLNVQISDRQLTLKLDQVEVQLPLPVLQDPDFDPQVVAQLLTANLVTSDSDGPAVSASESAPLQTEIEDEIRSESGETSPVNQFGNPSVQQLLMSQTTVMSSETDPIDGGQFDVAGSELRSDNRAEALPSTSIQIAFHIESGRVSLDTDNMNLPANLSTTNSTAELDRQELDTNHLISMPNMAKTAGVWSETTRSSGQIIATSLSQSKSSGEAQLSETEIQQATTRIQGIITNLAERSSGQPLSQMISAETRLDSGQAISDRLNIAFKVDSGQLTISVPDSDLSIQVPMDTDLPTEQLVSWIETVSSQSTQSDSVEIDQLVGGSQTVSVIQSPAVVLDLDLSSETVIPQQLTSTHSAGLQQMLGTLATVMEQSTDSQPSANLLQVSVPSGIQQVATGAKLQAAVNDNTIRLTLQANDPTFLNSLNGQLQQSKALWEPSIQSILSRLNVSAMQMTSIPAEPDLSNGTSLLSAIQGVSDQPQNSAVSLNPTLSSEAEVSNFPAVSVDLPNLSAGEGQRTADAAFRTTPTEVGLPGSTEVDSVNQTEDLLNPSETASPLLDSSVDADEAPATRMGRQVRQVTRRGGLADPTGAAIAPQKLSNNVAEVTEPTTPISSMVSNRLNNSALGQSFNSETAFGGQGGDASDTTEDSESMFTESDPFISVLEQENEAKRLAHLSTSPQREVNETGRISSQDELRSQFAEARQIRDARQDIIREIQSMQNSRRQETEREMTIQLRPARLGRLVVRVSQHREQSGSSTVAVQIQASSTEAQQMLMHEMSDLQSDLQSQGIDLTGLEVSVDSGRNFHQSRSQGRFFTDYQRQVQSRRGQNPSELQNAGISSTSNRTKIGTQYANSQLNLVV